MYASEAIDILLKSAFEDVFVVGVCLLVLCLTWVFAGADMARVSKGSNQRAGEARERQRSSGAMSMRTLSKDYGELARSSARNAATCSCLPIATQKAEKRHATSPVTCLAHGSRTTKKAVVAPSPISTLPVEILSYILEHAELSYRSEFNRLADVPSTCVHTFCLVSKFWYAVALKTPVLWTRLAIANDGDIARSAEWVRRSPKQMLSLSMRLDPWGRLAYSDVHTLLEPHSKRIQRLSLEFPPYETPKWRIPPSFSRICFLRLEDVTFDFAMICDILKSSPRLETLIAHATHYHRDGPRQEEDEIPAETRLLDLQLHTECLDIITEVELCHLLYACPSLEFLSLSFPAVFGAWLPPNSLPPVRLPRLVAASLPISRFSEELMNHWRVPDSCYTSFGHRLSCAWLHDMSSSDGHTTTYFDRTYTLDFRLDRHGMELQRIVMYFGWVQSIEELTIKNSKRDLSMLLDYILIPNRLTRKWDMPQLRVLRIENCPKWEYDLLRFGNRIHPLLQEVPVKWRDFTPADFEGVYIYNCPAFKNVEDARNMFRKYGTSFHFGHGTDGDSEVRSEAEVYEREMTMTTFPFDVDHPI